MSKGGRAKKKLALPPSGAAQGKRVGDVRSLLPGAAASDDRVCWRFTHVDHDGPWGFDSMDPATLCEVLTKLRDCETMTLNELRTTRRLFKEYELPGGLSKDAVARLGVIGFGDATKIQRLEFTGTQRLYGFLVGNIFHVLWWDPSHQVYPSKLKHT
ncbi:hypothetical protein KZO11_14225 [Streptomyces anulatus]|uniref:hypothetical protein n=1 Tax=Streptomyces anulatus TaxID=1892 RepID=UPI001C5EC7F6|nr:hypothetical protein [Streptomyces anulatus]QYA94765.1 hypothetical protein KZO11_14225 [Streptomyces anulatus]